MDIWPELHLTCARFRLEVEHPRKFGWFPEAVLRGALGYFWHAEGKRFERLYELFFGAADKAKLQGIATPPIGAVLNCSPCGGSFFELEVILFGKHEEQVPLLLESLHILGREGVGESYERFFVEGFPRYGVGELREWVLNEPIDEPLASHPLLLQTLASVVPSCLTLIGNCEGSLPLTHEASLSAKDFAWVCPYQA
jgi:hypothetical protein